jgi:hypothetical protein
MCCDADPQTIVAVLSATVTRAHCRSKGGFGVRQAVSRPAVGPTGLPAHRAVRLTG